MFVRPPLATNEAPEKQAIPAVSASN